MAAAPQATRRSRDLCLPGAVCAWVCGGGPRRGSPRSAAARQARPRVTFDDQPIEVPAETATRTAAQGEAGGRQRRPAALDWPCDRQAMHFALSMADGSAQQEAASRGRRPKKNLGLLDSPGSRPRHWTTRLLASAAVTREAASPAPPPPAAASAAVGPPGLLAHFPVTALEEASPSPAARKGCCMPRARPGGRESVAGGA